MSNMNFDKEYFTIKEFSEIVGLPVATLRYYDKEGIFCPAMHGTGSLRNTYCRPPHPSR
ncbi:MAG: MerR family DNA-binding transcriptional regulator [Oscillospiraceae bacterium]|nr:MerR family DNA-binding transcriptional regulator [Oscillospiraceae bacterium]MCL2279486.1 MerR family DNA-binding transcriptional regulator [Oscillospiraceae bacterium]